MSEEDKDNKEEVITPELVDDSSEDEADAIDPDIVLSQPLPKSSSKDLVRYDPLESYLSEIRSLPTLSREEEHELALKFQEGDQMAGYRLVMANLRLVVLIAKEYQRNFKNILDLVQEGNIGLLEAVKKYDPYQGTRFPSYAVYWIRAYMLRYLINNIRLVKVGTTQAQRKLFFNLQKEKDKLEAEGFRPEAKLLAERLNVKESEVLEMEQRLALPDLSVDAPTNRDDDSGDYHSLLSDGSATAEEIVAEQNFRQEVRSVVEELSKSLDEKELAIIDKRLLAEEPATLQEIADEYDLSRERIRQIEVRLKKILKERLSDKLQLGEEGEVLLADD